MDVSSDSESETETETETSSSETECDSTDEDGKNIDLLLSDCLWHHFFVLCVFQMTFVCCPACVQKSMDEHLSGCLF